VKQIVQQVQSETALQIPPVAAELEKIHRISEEMEKLLQHILDLQKRSPIRQWIKALSTGKRDAERLKGVLGYLSQARGDLDFQIHLVHIKVTSRIDRNVQTVVDSTSDLRAAQGPSIPVDESFNNRQPDTPDKWTPGLGPPVTANQSRASVYGNTALDKTKQVNGVVGVGNPGVPTVAKVGNNTSSGESKQTNIIWGSAHAFNRSRFCYVGDTGSKNREN
jgi:hypothetical protein